MKKIIELIKYLFTSNKDVKEAVSEAKKIEEDLNSRHLIIKELDNLYKHRRSDVFNSHGVINQEIRLKALLSI